MNPDPNQTPEETPAPVNPETPTPEVNATPEVASTSAPEFTPAPEPTPEVAPAQSFEQPAEVPVASPTTEPVTTPEVVAPTAAPNPFTQPTTAIGSSPNSDPLPTAPAGGSKKKRIILISAIVGGLLILGGIAAAVYFLFFSVSKADYKQAYDQLQSIQTKVSGSALSSDPDSLKVTFEEYKTENAKLGDLKALRADGELNEKYKAYDEKATAYIAFMDAFIPSFEKLTTATKVMSSGGSMLKSSSVEATITALEKASDATDPDVKAYVDALLAVYKEILPQVKIYETSSVSADRLKALTAMSTSTRSLSTTSTKFSTDLKARYEKVSPKETFDALAAAVTKKYNEQ